MVRDRAERFGETQLPQHGRRGPKRCTSGTGQPTAAMKMTYVPAAHLKCNPRNSDGRTAVRARVEIAPIRRASRRLRKAVQQVPTEGVRPNASENSQISPSTTVRAAPVDGSRPNPTSVLQEGWKNANICARSAAIQGNSG
jgi:hypothetical protein